MLQSFSLPTRQNFPIRLHILLLWRLIFSRFCAFSNPSLSYGCHDVTHFNSLFFSLTPKWTHTSNASSYPNIHLILYEICENRTIFYCHKRLWLTELYCSWSVSYRNASLFGFFFYIINVYNIHYLKFVKTSFTCSWTGFQNDSLFWLPSPLALDSKCTPGSTYLKKCKPFKEKLVLLGCFSWIPKIESQCLNLGFQEIPGKGGHKMQKWCQRKCAMKN